MPCDFFRSPDGKMVGVICSRGRHEVKRCAYCGKPATILCDYPLPSGKTCDRPMCNKCRTKIGPDLDVCRVHNNPSDIAITLSGGNQND